MTIEGPAEWPTVVLVIVTTVGAVPRAEPPVDGDSAAEVNEPVTVTTDGRIDGAINGVLDGLVESQIGRAHV